MNKAKEIETMSSLPEEFRAEELIEKLLFLEKVEKGQQDVLEGKTSSFEEVKKHISISLN